MIFSIIGPNLAGKSRLLRLLVSNMQDIYPVSLTNFPPRKYRFKKRRAINVKGRTSMLKDVWGYAYYRTLFEPHRKYIVEEGLLTKILRVAPVECSMSKYFLNDWILNIDNIKYIESEYVDYYIYLRPDLTQWKRNSLSRPGKLANQDFGYNRFKTQVECLDKFLSLSIPQEKSIVINILDDNSLNKVISFIRGQ